jgi:2-polyprenyl-3-methyl-5-hydroxy-6-metoxy-1,4-benzoquinol methylase
MKLSLPQVLGDDSDKAWRWFGEHDAYYGVLSGSEFRRDNLTEERFEAFWATGAAHVDRVLNLATHHFGAIGHDSCLDFGSGVGRLAIPFARHFRQVIGVDISPPMIAEAQSNCRKLGVQNVTFSQTMGDAEMKYDLVHTYIVLQHIPLSRGLQLIGQLIDRTRPGGVCFLHFTIGRNAGRLRKLASFMRKNVKPAHWLLNAREGKQLFEPYMQSNEYRLNELVAYLYDRNIRQIWLESENHGGPYSVAALFRVPPSTGA